MNEPSGHTLHCVEPTAEKDPAAHCWHEEECGDDANEPAGQASHEAETPLVALE